MTTGIVEFLHARLDEDEFDARRAFLATMPGTENWRSDGHQVWSHHSPPTLVVKHTWPHESDHIARHDPARALRDVEAKRAIIANCIAVPKYSDDITATTTARGTLSDLATVYSDHPDYQEDWSA